MSTLKQILEICTFVSFYLQIAKRKFRGNFTPLMDGPDIRCTCWEPLIYSKGTQIHEKEPSPCRNWFRSFKIV